MRRARSIGRPQPGTGGLRSARIPAESAPRPARILPARTVRATQVPAGPPRPPLLPQRPAAAPGRLRAVPPPENEKVPRSRLVAPGSPNPARPSLPRHNAAAPRPLPGGGAVRCGAVGGPSRALCCRRTAILAEGRAGPRAVCAARLPAERWSCAGGDAEGRAVLSGARSGFGPP